MSQILDVESKVVVIEKTEENNNVRSVIGTYYWDVKIARYNGFYLLKASYTQKKYSTEWNIVNELNDEEILRIVEYHNGLINPQAK